MSFDLGKLAKTAGGGGGGGGGERLTIAKEYNPVKVDRIFSILTGSSKYLL